MKFDSKVMYVLISLVTLGSVSLAEVGHDNSKVNKRDRSEKELTADQQKVNANDTKITARIRRDVMKEKELSTYAQNIKIITVDGKVTLKGPVRSTAEENIILKYARSVAGASNVTNEIAITPENTN